MSSLFDQIQNQISTHDVVLYMKGNEKFPMCGFSGTVVQILNNLNVPFLAVDVMQEPGMRDGIKEFTNWPTIPQLYVKGEFIGGCDIVREMYQTGELQEFLMERSIIYPSPMKTPY